MTRIGARVLELNTITEYGHLTIPTQPEFLALAHSTTSDGLTR